VADISRACKYRTREEEADWLARDPLERFRKQLLQAGVLSEDDMKQIDATLTAEITDAIDYALASPDPVPEQALEHVYAP
jgi:acetoin:2,6-dichlorophenolindophenol oxidoreductase subunit alpha